MTPSTIGRYEIRRELGRGMMGVVYEAYDPTLGRIIALKTIQLAFAVTGEERRSFEERFLTEARVAARLSHPGIVVVHDVGGHAEDGTLYIALEFLRGRTLAEAVADGARMEWREALRIVQRVAEALHHAHGEGVIHRDIKPANIMMLPSGDPKIMDFGIAKVETSQLTAAGQFFGTPLYMSPEQAMGLPLDARSDLFSLGALAYGLLTGRQAFAGSAVPHILTRVLREDPAPPSHVVPTLPPEVDYLLARALAKDPNDRYPSGRALAEDIEDVRAGRGPRHREGWTAPRRADGTMVASVGDAQPEAAGEIGSLVFETPPGAVAAPPARTTGSRGDPAPVAADRPRQWRRAMPWIAAAVTAGLLAMALMRGGGGSPSSGRSTPGDAPARPSAPDAAASADKPARLAIDFEHSLRTGKLRVWVDDDLVVDEALDSRVTRKVAALKFRKGSVEETLELTPGKHAVRVQVAWDDNVRTETIFGSFAPGSTRRLSGRLLGLGGLGVRRRLSLDWE